MAEISFITSRKPLVSPVVSSTAIPNLLSSPMAKSVLKPPIKARIALPDSVADSVVDSASVAIIPFSSSQVKPALDAEVAVIAKDSARVSILTLALLDTATHLSSST